MDILEFIVQDSILKRIDNHEVISRKKDFYTCKFIFDDESEWVSIDKFVLFRDGWDNKITRHIGDEGNILFCTVPYKIMQGSYFKISIYGGDLATTINPSIPLTHVEHTSSLTEEPCINNPCSKEEDDIWIEIFSKLNSKIDRVEVIDDILYCYANDVCVYTVPLINIDGLSDVAISGSYNDLENIPSSFNPSPHNHVVRDVVDFTDNVDIDLNNLLDSLSDEIIKKI